MSPERRGLTIGSLFAGIGGLELGLERAGVGRTVWQVEQNAYCRAVLAKHWPDATRYEDVRDVGRANLVPVDVICGGFPCQDISVAGRREGLAGERSGLWFEYSRIIRELRPRYVVVENVARLLADGMGVVLGELAALGYDAEWDCIPASSVGAPHERDRVFIVAHVAGIRCEGWGAKTGWEARRAAKRFRWPEPDANVADDQELGRGTRWPRGSNSGGARQPEQPLSDMADADRERRHGRRETMECHSGHTHISGARPECDAATGDAWWSVEPDVGRVAHGLSTRLVGNELHALGNAVVPQVAEVVGRVILELEQQRLAS